LTDVPPVPHRFEEMMNRAGVQLELVGDLRESQTAMIPFEQFEDVEGPLDRLDVSRSSHPHHVDLHWSLGPL